MDSDNSDSLLILVGMFADYEKSVIAFYKVRKANKMLSPLLIDLTPGNLKRECKVVCEERYHRKDEWTLRAFFGQGGDKETCLQAIKRCDIDKFRPLINFLAGKARSTADTNIELLAWLIDFKPRPHDDKYDYENPETPNNQEKVPGEKNAKEVEDEVCIDGKGENTDESAPEPSKSANGSFNFNLWKGVVVIALLVVIIVGISFYIGRPPKVLAPVFTGLQACMFWDRDHYQQVSCSPKLGDTLVIALDSDKLNHFRMITRPDTITDECKGKVWYVKFNGKMEFYTADGYHPIDQRFRLRPATSYIIRKYCNADH